jgi:CO/xanthine dehydrogenase Mo-binding subunit
MNAPAEKNRFSRRTVLKGGALVVGFTLTGRPTSTSAQGVTGAPRLLDAKAIDAYLTVNGDGTVTVYCGKVDLGQGLRIAIPQIAAEELGIGIEKIRYVEGDTALTPNQGRTSGSNGIQRGGMQIRQAATTARKAIIDIAAQRLNLKPEDLTPPTVKFGRKPAAPASDLPACSAVSSSTSNSIRMHRSRLLRATRSSANPCRGLTWQPNAWEPPPTSTISPCQACSTPV